MDDIRWWNPNGRADACRRDVPIVAPCDATWRVVSQYGDAGADWLVLCHCRGAADILCGNDSCSESWNLDLS